MSPSEMSKHPSPLSAAVTHALNVVESNLREPKDAGTLINEFEVSHRYFERLFRSIVGLSFGNYLRLRRLSEASLLLRNSNQRILDIAVEFNFKSQESFTRAFKKFSGLTPAQFRNQKQYVLTEFRSAISEDRIHAYWQQIPTSPQIVTCDIKFLAGFRVEFKNHFEEGSDCALKVTRHWKSVLPQLMKIHHRIKGSVFGVALSDEQSLRSKSLTYFSAVEVPNIKTHDIKLPHLEIIEIPAGTYAIFQNNGNPTEHSTLIDYIYGVWLPSSKFVRGDGYDYESFDKEYKLEQPGSISYYYLPIKQVSK